MQPAHHDSELTSATRFRAFSIHIFTALGGGIALIALLEAVREHWAAMFGWLGLALLIDAIDGPLARRFDVNRVLPNWSGDTLDLVVDFLTYVFVPAYAIVASRLLVPLASPLLGIAIVVSGALYFSDRRMKADDNHFRGFPALWNGAAFYLFLIKPSPWIASLLIAVMVVLTFVPFNTIHPVRTLRLRTLNLVLIALWAIFGIWTLVMNFDVPLAISIILCAIAAYLLFSDTFFKFSGWK